MLYILLELFSLTIANCGRPDDISNGSVDVQRGASHGSDVTYRCDAGFTLSGSRKRTCDDGRWSPERPTCKGIIIVVIDVIVIVIVIIITIVVVLIINIIIIITSPSSSSSSSS